MEKQNQNEIFETLKELEFVMWGKPIWNDWIRRKTIGWNGYASSLIRKRYTLERLREFISDMNLPLVIKDWPDSSNAFQIYIKDYV